MTFRIIVVLFRHIAKVGGESTCYGHSMNYVVISQSVWRDITKNNNSPGTRRNACSLKTKRNQPRTWYKRIITTRLQKSSKTPYR